MSKVATVTVAPPFHNFILIIAVILGVWGLFSLGTLGGIVRFILGFGFIGFLFYPRKPLCDELAKVTATFKT